MLTVQLEDNQEYIILDKIIVNNIKYIYLTSKDDSNDNDFVIRKLVDNEENIAGLDNEEEYNIALDAYNKKYEDIIM